MRSDEGSICWFICFCFLEPRFPNPTLLQLKAHVLHPLVSGHSAPTSSGASGPAGPAVDALSAPQSASVLSEAPCSPTNSDSDQHPSSHSHSSSSESGPSATGDAITDNLLPFDVEALSSPFRAFERDLIVGERELPEERCHEKRTHAEEPLCSLLFGAWAPATVIGTRAPCDSHKGECSSSSRRTSSGAASDSAETTTTAGRASPKAGTVVQERSLSDTEEKFMETLENLFSNLDGESLGRYVESRFSWFLSLPSSASNAGSVRRRASADVASAIYREGSTLGFRIRAIWMHLLLAYAHLFDDSNLTIHWHNSPVTLLEREFDVRVSDVPPEPIPIDFDTNRRRLAGSKMHTADGTFEVVSLPQLHRAFPVSIVSVSVVFTSSSLFTFFAAAFLRIDSDTSADRLGVVNTVLALSGLLSNSPDAQLFTQHVSWLSNKLTVPHSFHVPSHCHVSDEIFDSSLFFDVDGVSSAQKTSKKKASTVGQVDSEDGPATSGAESREDCASLPQEEIELSAEAFFAHAVPVGASNVPAVLGMRWHCAKRVTSLLSQLLSKLRAARFPHAGTLLRPSGSLTVSAHLAPLKLTWYHLDSRGKTVDPLHDPTQSAEFSWVVSQIAPVAFDLQPFPRSARSVPPDLLALLTKLKSGALFLQNSLLSRQSEALSQLFQQFDFHLDDESEAKAVSLTASDIQRLAARAIFPPTVTPLAFVRMLENLELHCGSDPKEMYTLMNILRQHPQPALLKHHVLEVLIYRGMSLDMFEYVLPISLVNSIKQPILALLLLWLPGDAKPDRDLEFLQTVEALFVPGYSVHGVLQLYGQHAQLMSNFEYDFQTGFIRFLLPHAILSGSVLVTLVDVDYYFVLTNPLPLASFAKREGLFYIS